MSGMDRISLRELMKASLQGLWCVVNLRSQHGSEAAEDGHEKKIPKITVSIPTTSWLIEREKWEAVTDFTSFVCKITSDSDCSHKIKAFALGKESYGKPRQHIKKQRCHFLTKLCTVKALIFPIVTGRCESWTIKKAEHWRTDAFELWCWRRRLRVRCTARRSNQSILKEISQTLALMIEDRWEI